MAIDERAGIASSPTGFGGRPDWWTWVPPFSTATVTASRVAVSPLKCPEGPLPDDITRAHARATVVSVLREQGAQSLGELLRSVGPLSAREKLRVTYDPTYEALFSCSRRVWLSKDCVFRGR